MLNLIFFRTVSANDLWKGVTSVSNAGRKRGRGRGAGRKKAKDLNRGQRIGFGKINFIWPGLNAPIIKGRETISMKRLPENKDYQDSLIALRNEMDTFERTRLHPLARGWAGVRPGGQWIKGDTVFSDEILKTFVCTVLSVRGFLLMRSERGKSRRIKIISVIGNQNGCAGIGIGKAAMARDATRRSFINASNELLAINLWENRTIIHDFHSRYGVNKIFAHKMPAGFGIVAHRVIRSICIAIGIKDIYCKSEGPSRNHLNIARAFLLGLKMQKSFQEMADEKKLHVVEFKPETNFFPTLLASPKDNQVRKLEEITKEEPSDFHMYLHNGQVQKLKPKKYPAYTRTIGYETYLKDYHYQKTRQDVRVYLKAKYGCVESFLNVRERAEREKRKMEVLKETASAS